MNPTNDNSQQDKEERALDALIAGLLRPSSRDEILDPGDIAPFVGAQEPRLSAAAEAALATLGPDPVASILRGRQKTQDERGVEAEVMAGEFCGMYRKNSTGENTPEDEAELERQRQEALKKLRNKDGENQGPTDGERD